ncbi:MAG: T9SS type A sorting domain-containing protein, partial [Candidatus Marinimicrobia bacterium]|nr:T9SS type A sorting domain-containing protein [Candidatus Neomarinimicrobiota bacterium]
LDGFAWNEGGEVRGCIPGDLDRDGLPDLYFAGNNFGAIMDMEHEGGSVTDESSYSFYYTLIDGGAVDGGRFGRPANVDLADMDNDGHLEIVATVPWSGDNPVANLLGLYVFEFDPTVGIEPESPKDQLPSSFALKQNYPNPFNPVTSIAYDLSSVTYVTLKVYDLLGRHVRTLVNESQIAGSYLAVWDGKDNTGGMVSTGIYLYRLETEQFISTKKMVLLR